MFDVRRREFLTLLGGAAAWPLAAHAQQTAMPVIGFLSGASPNEHTIRLKAFLQGLQEVGYVEGQNVGIEYRWAEARTERLPSLATELLNRQVTASWRPGALLRRWRRRQPLRACRLSSGSQPTQSRLGLSQASTDQILRKLRSRPCWC
jgi:hypothetical protein